MADIAVTAARVAPVNETEYEAKTYRAAAAITAGQLLYQDTNGRAALARANATGTIQSLIGIALNDAAAGRPVVALRRGSVAGFTLSVNPGVPVFASSATAGALGDAVTTGTGNFVAPVGVVDTITEADGTIVKVLFVEIAAAHAAYTALP